MSSGSQAQAVDYSGVQSGFQNLASTFNRYMTESYDWAKGQWKKQEPYSDEIQQILLDQAKAGADWAKADRAMFEEHFAPIAKEYAQQVRTYDTPGRREAEAGRYAAAASNAAEQAGDEAKRQLTTFGVKPTDVRFGALDLGTRMSKAANAVAASESARRNVENTGLALKQGAIPLGQQFAGQAINNYGMSQNAGVAGANVGIGTDTAYGNLMGTPTQWGGLNVNALQGWNQSLTDQQKANIALKEANSSSGGFGKLAGTIIGGAAGAYFGGPMGMSAGASMGGSLGGMTGFAKGGVVDITDDMGGYVPPGMSPSRGAVTDDIPAVIPGANGQPPQMAAINAEEFIFPREAAKYYGTQKLQSMVDKANVAMGLAPPSKSSGGGKGGGASDQRGSRGGSGAPPATSGVIPSYQAGGAIDPELAAWSETGHAASVAAMQPNERSWKDIGRDALAGAGAMGKAMGSGSEQPKRSALDIYSRWGYADGGEVDRLPLPGWYGAEAGRGRVSESTDTGTANARADAISIEDAHRSYGPNNTWIRNRAGTINPEPKVSPLIQIYPSRRYAEGGVVDTRPFDPEGEGYDDETARRQGLTPDSTGHGSTYGEGGIMLKGARHPTRHLSIIEDERLGYESYRAQDGRYYVRPKGGYGYEDGGVVHMAQAGRRWTDPDTGDTYEEVPWPKEGRWPQELTGENYGGKGMEGSMPNVGGKQWFKMITKPDLDEFLRQNPGSLGAPPMKLYRRLDRGYPTS